jgi:hypothetical protein
MKKSMKWLAAAALLVVATSCQKSTPSPSTALPSSNPQALITMGGGLMYFGTPHDIGNGIGCFQPCGFCHVERRAEDWKSDMNNPDNNEAATDISITTEGHLLLSADLTGVGMYYINDITSTGQFAVAINSEIPHDLADEACDAAGVPHFAGPVTVPAGNYPVLVTAGGQRFNMEGTYTAGGWSWEFRLE